MGSVVVTKCLKPGNSNRTDRTLRIALAEIRVQSFISENDLQNRGDDIRLEETVQGRVVGCVQSVDNVALIRIEIDQQ